MRGDRDVKVPVRKSDALRTVATSAARDEVGASIKTRSAASVRVEALD
jgi:hypothetical protein